MSMLEMWEVPGRMRRAHARRGVRGLGDAAADFVANANFGPAPAAPSASDAYWGALEAGVAAQNTAVNPENPAAAWETRAMIAGAAPGDPGYAAAFEARYGTPYTPSSAANVGLPYVPFQSVSSYQQMVETATPAQLATMMSPYGLVTTPSGAPAPVAYTSLPTPAVPLAYGPQGAGNPTGMQLARTVPQSENALMPKYAPAAIVRTQALPLTVPAAPVSPWVAAGILVVGGAILYKWLS